MACEQFMEAFHVVVVVCILIVAAASAMACEQFLVAEAFHVVAVVCLLVVACSWRRYARVLEAHINRTPPRLAPATMGRASPRLSPSLAGYSGYTALARGPSISQLEAKIRSKTSKNSTPEADNLTPDNIYLETSLMMSDFMGS